MESRAEVASEDVDMEFIPSDVGEGVGHLEHMLVPVGHGDRDSVGFGSGGEMFLLASLRQIEGESWDAVDGYSRYHSLLNDDLTHGFGKILPPIELRPKLDQRSP